MRLYQWSKRAVTTRKYGRISGQYARIGDQIRAYNQQIRAYNQQIRVNNQQLQPANTVFVCWCARILFFWTAFVCWCARIDIDAPVLTSNMLALTSELILSVYIYQAQLYQKSLWGWRYLRSSVPLASGDARLKPPASGVQTPLWQGWRSWINSMGTLIAVRVDFLSRDVCHT
jgi:hypothetical protein